MSTPSVSDSQTPVLLRTLVAALEEKKAADLQVLDVGGISDITDYLVLATGNSEPHLRALRIEVEKVFDTAKVPIAGTEQGDYGSGWTIVDAFQIMVHVFTAEQRGNYSLEKLWKDARVIDPSKLDQVEPRKTKRAAPKPKAKKAPAKPKSAGAKKPAAKRQPAAKSTKAATAPKAKSVKPAKASAPAKRVRG